MTIPNDYDGFIQENFFKDYNQIEYNEATYTYPTPLTQKQRILDKLEKLLDILLEE